MSIASIESDLLLRAIGGDRASLSRIFLLHYSGLQEHIQSRLSRDIGRFVDADDILHQTLLRAARGIGSFEPRHAGSFSGWLKTIADNLLKDTAKRARRERRVADTPAHGPGLGGGSGQSHSWAAFVDRLAGDITSPSVRTQKYENARHLRVALAALPEDYREVIERYYLKEQSYVQIADAMGSTKNAIRALCYRARKRLRELMGQSDLYFSG